MTDVMEVAETNCEVTAHVEDLYDRGLYRQALDHAEAAWGRVRSWRGSERRLLGSRLVGHLGLFRLSAALVLASWRQDVRSFDLTHAYVRTIFNMYGPYLARCAMQRLQDSVATAVPEDQARWLCLQAVVQVAFRDWEAAHACLDAASQLEPEPARLLFERSWLYEQQDRYEEALAALDAMPADTVNWQRVQLQCRARLLEIMSRPQEAIALLRDGFARMESVDVGMSLHRMLTECGEVDAADACLSRVRALVPAGEKYIGDSIAIACADVLYKRGRFDEALAALAPVRGYFFRTIRENLERHRDDGVRHELVVPFVRQHHMTCVPATIAAIWRYHGHHVDHLDLAEAICYDGTSDLAERRWLEEQGWCVREFELNLDDVATLIAAGCPPGLVTVEPGSAHMQAIMGYDTRKGVYLLRDPYFPSVRELLIEGAHEAYAASGPRCIVTVPPERRDWLMSLPLRHAGLYEEYFRLQLALDGNARDAAVQHAARLEEMAPGHRLSLWAQRSIAQHDNDNMRLLQQTNALIEKFPSDLNLLVGKARVLADLGKEAERLAFLEDCRRRGISHPYLAQALAEQMAQDNRRVAETRALLHDILRFQPLNTAAWWTLASVHWDGMERDEAFSCYRLCICLGDKMEGYASSYFKAARFLRRTDEALAYLKGRIEWLGSRSANPFITYARALDLLNRGSESLVILKEALQRHPEDSWLLAEVVDFMCSAGDFQGAQALLDEKGGLLPEVSRLYRQVGIMTAISDAHAELACYRRILELQPRNDGAVANITRLLHATQSLSAALEFIDLRLQENPHNLWLLHEKLGYVARLPLQERRPVLEAMHELHPEDGRIIAAWARILKSEGRLEEAQSLLRNAIAMDTDAAWLYLALGDACMEAGDVPAARAAFESAIRISVDVENAFSKLVSTYDSFAERQAAFHFIHSELMRQVSFGNGIMEFQLLARRYLADAQVRDFLDVAVQTRPDLWQSWVALAAFCTETSQLDEAIKALDEGVTRFPLLPRLWLDRGEAHRLAGHVEQAERDVRAAIDINPAYSAAITKHADILEMLGQPEAALAAIDRGLQRDALYLPYHGYRADLLWRMGQRDEAFACLMQAVQLDSGYDWAWTQLQNWAGELERVDDIRLLAEELVTRFPESSFLWQQCATFADDRARKHECLRKAYELAPQQSAILLARCDLLAEEGRLSDARLLIASACAERGKTTEILTYEAWLTVKSGRLQEAIAELEAVVAVDPAHYNAWRLLTRWHDAAGNHDDCCRCARQCVALFPQNAAVLGVAADFLLRHASKEGAAAIRQEAREYLLRALNQDQTNAYNVLTLADLYLDDGDLDDCEALLSRILLDSQNTYIKARHLRLHVARGRLQPALDIYGQLLKESEEDWVIQEPLRWFRKAGQASAVWGLLRGLMEKGDAGTSVARAWMNELLADGSDGRSVLAALNHLENRALWRAAVIYALSGVATDAQLSPLLSALLWQRDSEICRYADTWSAVVAHLVGKDQWDTVRAVAKHAERHPDAQARALYFCGIAARLAGQDERAHQLMGLAMQRDEDDSRDNLRFWQQFEHWFHEPAKVQRDVLDGLNLRELVPIEVTLLDWLRLLLQLPPVVDDEGVRQFLAGLVRLRQQYPQHQDERILVRARRRMAFRLLFRGAGEGLLRYWRGLRMALAAL